MKRILVLNKKEGETPLFTLQNFRRKNKEYKDVKMTYAGRLDPMASGLLLVLAGNATKQKEKYLKLSKEYKFSVLFGFTTDTHDILGKVVKAENSRGNITKKELEKKTKENLKFFTGKFKQRYPMYSSRTVAGKPLFVYARAGRGIKSPEHEVSVESLKFLKIKKISEQKFLENIEYRITKVKGDFRQKEILKIWRKNLNVKHHVKHRVFDREFLVASFYIKCGSGTYIRAISNDLGKKIKIPALAFSIKRTKIGKWGKIQ
jgi:tRNA pseudouridine55 synthase